MIPARVHHYRDPAAVRLGLDKLSARGLSPRGLLFVALDPRGEAHVATPDELDTVTSVRVGDKLTLKPPWEGRYYHLDAIHHLPGDTLLVTGDRRLEQTSTYREVSRALGDWLAGGGHRNVFLGCTPHRPGCWWLERRDGAPVKLHDQGLVDAVVTATGLIARAVGEPDLYHLSFADLRRHGARSGWTRVFTSPLGAVLLVERRVLNYSLVITCERGVVELDVSGLPDEVRAMGIAELEPGIGVVGRIDGGAFAITRGEPTSWGLSGVTPAVLHGAPNQSIRDLPGVLEDDR